MIQENDRGFTLDVQLNGERAQALNRTLLSALRRVERRTTRRAEWTSAGTTVERFFDYVSLRVVAPSSLQSWVMSPDCSVGKSEGFFHIRRELRFMKTPTLACDES
jgi:hypothetical protein